MRRIIISDIFGRTPALDKLCHAIIPDIDIIDPYCGNFMDFPNEHEAYKYFMKRVGINEYCQIIKSILSKESSPVTLISRFLLYSSSASVRENRDNDRHATQPAILTHSLLPVADSI